MPRMESQVEGDQATGHVKENEDVLIRSGWKLLLHRHLSLESTLEHGSKRNKKKLKALKQVGTD